VPVAPVAAEARPPVTAAAADIEAETAARHGASARKSPSSRAASVSTSGTRSASSQTVSVAKAAVPARAAPAPQGPREACGNRTQFSLYRCMQQQCEKAQWFMHPSCKRLRLRDEVD
jgi:non-specific serine/threonine protein kinase